MTRPATSTTHPTLGSRPRYRESVAALSAAQKSGAGVPAYLRWVNRGLGRRLAALAHVAGMSPNQVTTLSMGASVVAALLMVTLPATVPAAVGIVVLLLLGYALDSADGQLARLQGSGSPAGEWLDHVMDAVRQPLVHLAVGLHLARHTDERWSWAAAGAGVFMVVASAWFLSQLLAEQLAARSASTTTPVSPGTSTSPWWLSFVKLPYDTGFLYLGLLLLPWPSIFVPFYLALLGLTILVACLSGIRKYATLAATPSPARPGRSEP
ncbi:CDP-alcohol phosphatidyltransferase family protein [Ornithinimicrobium panacihumi]|uniref:CDP-alcohol phosphatidyltransferase family protein n=1 Tax=Ornithinimicrobium panacihumi TaxID=2008449 RepID=UPI003F8A0CBF